MAAFKGKGAKAVQKQVERVIFTLRTMPAQYAVGKQKEEHHMLINSRQDTIPLMINGWKLWPVVALFNFVFVPVSRRIIVASIVGLFWGIYLSLFAALD